MGGNKGVSLSVEAPDRSRATCAHAGRRHATSNADRLDALMVKMAILFRQEP